MIHIEVIPIKDAYNVAKDKRYLIECFNCTTIISYDYRDLQYNPEQKQFKPDESYCLYVQCPVCKAYHKHTGEESYPIEEVPVIKDTPLYGRYPILYTWQEVKDWYNPFKRDTLEIDSQGFIWKNKELWRSIKISNR